ncbi:hypothetical protein Dimus_004423 [Dionaea muscipula]
MSCATLNCIFRVVKIPGFDIREKPKAFILKLFPIRAIIEISEPALSNALIVSNKHVNMTCSYMLVGFLALKAAYQSHTKECLPTECYAKHVVRFRNRWFRF